MSHQPAHEAHCHELERHAKREDHVRMIIRAAKKDLGGFSVRRALPTRKLRAVGPFVFVDLMGPSTFPPNGGIDVRPHPHIGLATVTYLFAGEIMHRDSLGTESAIRPGAVNWMTAGRGIVHSERMTDVAIAEGGELFGLQLWVALPKSDEEVEPSFRHYPAESLPQTEADGVKARVVVGDALGLSSPVETRSQILFVVAEMKAGSRLAVPKVPERGVFVIEGVAHIGDETVEGPALAVLAPDADVSVTADSPARVAILGGEPLDGPRHMWWNFVSSSRDRIEQAKSDWKEGRFPKVPHDEDEVIPLPE
jgi:redox-sensitive bicupin YhaK (pirin superfamily)